MWYPIIGLVIGLICIVVVMITNAFDVMDEIETSDLGDNILNALIAVMFLCVSVIAWPLVAPITIFTVVFTLIKKARE